MSTQGVQCGTRPAEEEEDDDDEYDGAVLQHVPGGARG